MHRSVCPLMLLAMVASIVGGCRSQDPEIFVSNVAAEEIISLNKSRDQGAVSGLHLHIEGQLEGTAQLLVLRDDNAVDAERLSGTIDIEWTTPWVHDRVRLHYLPGANVSGSVRIRYRFIASKRQAE